MINECFWLVCGRKQDVKKQLFVSMMNPLRSWPPVSVLVLVLVSVFWFCVHSSEQVLIVQSGLIRRLNRDLSVSFVPWNQPENLRGSGRFGEGRAENSRTASNIQLRVSEAADKLTLHRRNHRRNHQSGIKEFSVTGKKTWRRNASSRWKETKPLSPTWRWVLFFTWAVKPPQLFRFFMFPALVPQIPDGIAGDSMRDRTKTFTYDFSYDSSDCKSSTFVSQEKVTELVPLSL